MATVAASWMTPLELDSSFERLFILEYPRVVRIAYRVLGDAHQAEDVAQEVFYSFYRRHRADAPYAVPWLHKAAAHTALNVIRASRRRWRREQKETLAQERLRTSTEAAFDPQDALERSEQQREVRAALSRLSPKNAAVLALRYSGLSYTEVAGALGVNTGQVGTLLRRAEAALRKEMDHATP